MRVEKTYIYTAFERFWHWMQAALIFFLAATGFEIHGSFSFFGFEEAVQYHRIAAYALIVLIVFAIFWHVTTGAWRQYVPTLENIRAYFNYYLFGIFRNAPHPTRKTVLSKLNPLQKLVYFGLKTLIIPVIVVSGLLYMFYRSLDANGVEGLNVGTLKIIAVTHTAAAFAIIAFIIAHIYLTTTGETIFSNLKAMLTGYEEHIEPEGGDDPEQGKRREFPPTSTESPDVLEEQGT
ncbi:MAG: cytochrome b/b6 domain-containing protein [Bacteroidota bacterium]|nr:cytochrome b/b6 domain-containing protein [Bacteroidota bacterium]